MLAGNENGELQGQGLEHIPSPPTLLLQEGKQALPKPCLLPAPLASPFSVLAVSLLPV